ncbi:hypothetical protein [Clostridium baratii]|uniref:hypothetical protein n=1 Tax=Clostridium baratii TaxID=1561 RepID=UPI001C21ABB3|nr:hypothetical protein [Clostridium baratii]
MFIITNREIEELCKKMYSDDGDIVVRHNCLKGEKEFAMCMIANILALLERDSINDEFIIQYLQGLVALSKDNSKEYQNFLKLVNTDENTIKKALDGEKLSNVERKVLAEMMMSNLAEYTFKSDSQICCYSAMKVFFITTYCILNKNIDFDIESIDMVVDLDDELEKINIFPSKRESSFILVNWESTNKINSMYTLYKTQYSGLDNFSILELVSADVIAEDYYYKDDRFTIAPSILVKQYCSIVEHEINQIIQLLNYSDRPNKHLMWYDMKQYVKKHNIKLESAPFRLNKLLNEWYGLRNKASHGEMITKKEYEKISKYLTDGLFQLISQKKLDLQNIKLSPSVDEIGKYIR